MLYIGLYTTAMILAEGNKDTLWGSNKGSGQVMHGDGHSFRANKATRDSRDK